MSNKKYPRSEAMRTRSMDEQPGYYFADDKEGMKIAARAIEEYTVVERVTADSSYNSRFDTRFNDYSNILPGISGRPGLGRSGYNYFRPDESMGGQRHSDVIRRCNAIYKNVGLIRNIVDLMADFASKGIRLVHRNRQQEELFNNWFLKVNGPERSERFANYLIRTANVVVKRQTAKVPVFIEDELYRTSADGDLAIEDIRKPKVEKRVIPWKYTFIDASIVQTVGGPLASFVGKPLYSIVLPTELKKMIMAPKTAAEKAMVASLPPDILAAASSGKPYILPPDKTSVHYYKKDDWDSWATPIIFSIFKDIVAYEKLKLADLCALDGATSHIRIFRIGSLEHKLFPSPAAANKLNTIMQANTSAGMTDIIWGPDIDLIESKSDGLSQFLGNDKYIPTLNAIYAGLGIPPTLTGTGGAAGTTNNFISLKTLTDRLNYIRDMLVEFWTQEIDIVQKAMGLRFPATIEFDLMDLGNEEAIRTLYLNMADRNMLSDEMMQKLVKVDPKMEKIRLNREARDRKAGRMVRKDGPFIEPDGAESLKKIAAQQGTLAPSEFGVNLNPRKEGEKSLMDVKGEHLKEAGQQKIAQMKNTKGGTGGRPTGKKDSSKRKTKTFKPRSRAVTEIWVDKAQATIAEVLHPGILAHYGKKNFRQLSSAEAEHAEKIKFGVLSHIEPLSEINVETISEALNAGPVVADMYQIFDYDLKALAEYTEKPASIDDIRHLQLAAYIDYYKEYIDE